MGLNEIFALLQEFYAKNADLPDEIIDHLHIASEELEDAAA
jgi:hypothetical protein